MRPGWAFLSYPGAFKGETRNLTLDAYVGGPVSVAGRKHDVLIGVNRGAEKYQQLSSYDTSAIGVSLPLATLFDGTFAKPNFPRPYDLSLDTHTKRETVYGLVRLNLADPLKLTLGGNYTHATSEGASYGTPTDYDNSRFLPFVGATMDLSTSISASASFATIFNPQSQFDANNRLLDPIEGDNLEAGLKGEWFGGRFNASAAVFQARQKNTAEAAGFDAVLGRTIYRGVDARSQGIEFEIAGQPAAGVQVTGGVTVMRIKGDDDAAVRTFVPRNTGRLNITYSPPALEKLKLGTSIQYQSRIYLEPGTLATDGSLIRIRQRRLRAGRPARALCADGPDRGQREPAQRDEHEVSDVAHVRPRVLWRAAFDPGDDQRPLLTRHRPREYRQQASEARRRGGLDARSLRAPRWTAGHGEVVSARWREINRAPLGRGACKPSSPDT